MKDLYFVVPAGIDDPRRPSGGNVYDRRVIDGLGALGWSVRVLGGAALAGVPDGALVLIDGLVAPQVTRTDRLRLVVLLHMPGDVPAGAAAIVVTSQWTRRWVDEHPGLASVQVVAPGVHAAQLAAGTASGERLLCVGAVTPGKGQDLLVEALGRLDDLAWQCECVGALDVDPEFAANLRRDDRVRFTGPLTDIGPAYARSDALVVASRAESYGMVITEAMARGIPVIATDVGGVPEALGRAANGSLPGLLVPPEDPQALAGALRRWLGDPQERERLRGAARSRRRTLVGWEQTARDLSAVLARI